MSDVVDLVVQDARLSATRRLRSVTRVRDDLINELAATNVTIAELSAQIDDFERWLNEKGIDFVELPPRA